MEGKRGLSRREFIRLAMCGAAGLAGTALLASCAQEAPPAPTATPAPAAPTPTTAPAAAEPTATPAAAAPTATPEPAAPTPVPQTGGGRLTAWAFQSFTPEGDQLLGSQMEEFGKANNIEVEYVPLENKVVPEKLAAAVEANSPPDIQMFHSFAFLHYYKGGGHLVDVSDVWDEVSKPEGGFFDSVEPVFKADGKYWGIPFCTATAPLFTRLDLVEQVSGRREPPKTLDELTEMSRQMLNPPELYPIGICLGRVPDTQGNFMQLLWSDGGSLVDKDGKPNLNAQGTFDALARIKGWWDEKLIPPDATAWDDTGNNLAYQTKQSAFVINPPSIYWWLTANDLELLENTMMAPMAAGKSGGGYVEGPGSWSWGVFKLSKNIEGAKNLIRYVMEPTRLQAVYEKVGGRWYPVHRNLSNHPFWTAKPHFKYYPDMIQSGRYDIWPAEPDSKLYEAMGEAQTNYVFADMVQDVVVKNKSPEDAAADAHKRMEEIWKRVGLEV